MSLVNACSSLVFYLNSNKKNINDMENQNIGQFQKDAKVDGEEIQAIIFTGKSHNENNTVDGDVMNNRKVSDEGESVLQKSDVTSINVSNTNVERLWKDYNRFVNIDKFSQNDIANANFNSNISNAVMLTKAGDFPQYLGDQLPKINLRNFIDFNYCRNLLRSQILLSENLNNVYNSTAVCKFRQNIFEKLNRHNELIDYVMSSEKKNGNFQIDDERVKELFRIYKNVSAETNTSVHRKDYHDYEMDEKMFYGFLFEKCFNTEMKSRKDRKKFNEDGTYNENNINFSIVNSNHITAESDKIINVMCKSDGRSVNKSYYKQEIKPQEIDMKELTGNFDTETILLRNTEHMKENHVPLDFIYPAYSQAESQNTENIYLQDIMKESTDNFENGESVVNKKEVSNDTSKRLLLLLSNKYAHKINNINECKAENETHKQSQEFSNEVYQMPLDLCHTQTRFSNIEDSYLQDITKESAGDSEVETSLENVLNNNNWNKCVPQINNIPECKSKNANCEQFQAFSNEVSSLDLCHTQGRFTNIEDAYLQDITEESADDSEVETSLENVLNNNNWNKYVPQCKSKNTNCEQFQAFSNEVSPLDLCHTQTKFSNIKDTCHQDYINELAASEAETPLLKINQLNNSTCDKHSPQIMNITQDETKNDEYEHFKKCSNTDFVDPCERQTKYQNTEDTHYHKPLILALKHVFSNNGKCHPNATFSEDNFSNVVSSRTAINSFNFFENPKLKDSNALLCNKENSETVQCHPKHSLENDPKLSKVTDILSSNVKRHHKIHLIDQNFYKLRKEKQIADSMKFKPHHPKRNSSQLQVCTPINKDRCYETPCKLPSFENDSEKTEIANILLPNAKHRHHSKPYFKQNCKLSIDQDFYKLRSKTQTANSELNQQRQYCNQVKDNIYSNRNMTIEDDKTCNSIRLANNVPKNNLLRYGFSTYQKPTTSSASSLSKTTENLSSYASKTKSCPDVPCIFQRNSNSFNASNTPLDKLSKRVEKTLQPILELDEEQMDHGISLTNLKTDIYNSLSVESVNLKSEASISMTVAPCNSCNKLINTENSINSEIANINETRERKQRLFGYIKTDNVKRVCDIFGPRCKSGGTSSTLNYPNHQYKERELSFKEPKSGKRKLLSEPKIDKVKRVCHMLEPRWKSETL